MIAPVNKDRRMTMPARKRLLTRSDIESVKRIITHHDQQAFKFELLRKGNSLAERERRWALCR